MRDEKDPGTIEMSLKRKPGRPAVGEVAMSDAERAAKYRAGRRRSAVVARGKSEYRDLSDAALVDALRFAMAEGRRQAVLSIADVVRERYGNS